MVEIRAVRSADLAALYRIALATGDGGSDASTLYRDPALPGHLYAAPYAVLCPETVFVAEGTDGVEGYIVGAADTATFEVRLESAWWPRLRTAYADPAAASRAQWTLDQRRAHAIHHPAHAPAALRDAYPSHLHINLLPAMRGRGVGRLLMERWMQAIRELGSHGAHLAVAADNARAQRFYAACGFREPRVAVPRLVGAHWLARDVPRTG